MDGCNVTSDEGYQIIDSIQLCFHTIDILKERFISSEKLGAQFPPYILGGGKEGIGGILIIEYWVVKMSKLGLEVPLKW